MMNMVEAVSRDPLTPLKFSDTDGDEAGRSGYACRKTSNICSIGQYETKLLESTVEKITTLLRVGFGEAGAGIIKSNLSLSNTSSVINPLIEGVRVYAIVGFCDIHNFEEGTSSFVLSVQHLDDHVCSFCSQSATYSKCVGVREYHCGHCPFFGAPLGRSMQ
jgi:hypothetical protein